MAVALDVRDAASDDQSRHRDGVARRGDRVVTGVHHQRGVCGAAVERPGVAVGVASRPERAAERELREPGAGVRRPPLRPLGDRRVERRAGAGCSSHRTRWPAEPPACCRRRPRQRPRSVDDDVDGRAAPPAERRRCPAAAAPSPTTRRAKKRPRNVAASSVPYSTTSPPGRTIGCWRTRATSASNFCAGSPPVAKAQRAGPAARTEPEELLQRRPPAAPPRGNGGTACSLRSGMPARRSCRPAPSRGRSPGTWRRRSPPGRCRRRCRRRSAAGRRPPDAAGRGRGRRSRSTGGRSRSPLRRAQRRAKSRAAATRCGAAGDRWAPSGGGCRPRPTAPWCRSTAPGCSRRFRAGPSRRCRSVPAPPGSRGVLPRFRTNPTAAAPGPPGLMNSDPIRRGGFGGRQPEQRQSDRSAPRPVVVERHPRRCALEAASHSHATATAGRAHRRRLDAWPAGGSCDAVVTTARPSRDRLRSRRIGSHRRAEQPQSALLRRVVCAGGHGTPVVVSRPGDPTGRVHSRKARRHRPWTWVHGRAAPPIRLDARLRVMDLGPCPSPDLLRP